jgi:NAD(P)H-hydrate epimerase
MRILTVAQARALDRDAEQRLGMPSLLLMENASRAVAEQARLLGERFVVLAGPGNNGGDGLAAARHLGRAASVHLLAEPDPQKSPDAALQLRILRAAGQPVVTGSLPDPEHGVGAVWIDALFGTGLERPLQGPALQWVQALDAARGRKLAVDIPSGLHGDTGAVLGAAVHADVTVTFAAVKLGMTLGDGPRCCGRIVVTALGLPEERAGGW